MEHDTQYSLNLFREEEKDLFGEDGAFKVLNHIGPMNRMRALINQLESHSKLLIEIENFAIKNAEYANQEDILRIGQFVCDKLGLIPMVQKVNEKNKTIDFDSVAKPVIKWLCENYHPHTTIIITPTNAELLEGLKSTGEVTEFIAD